MLTTFEQDGKTYASIDQLTNWAQNPRELKRTELDRLKKLIRKHGEFRPLVVTNDGTVLGGNSRLKAFQELGMTNAWVSVVEAPDNKTKLEYALADNDHVATYDEQMLAELVMNTPEIELTDYKVDLGEPMDLSQLLAQFGPEPEIEEDEAPAPPAEPKSKWGDIYQLGRHRLMCGSATKPSDVMTLLDGTKPDLLFTDPPYGLGQKWSGGTWADNPMYDDAKRWDAKVIPFEAIERLIAQAPRAIVWGGNYYPLPPSRCWLAWIKSNQLQTMADFELAWTNIDAPAKAYTTSRNADGKRSHPTQKPVGLMMWGIRNYSEPEARVFDPFGGAGTSLIACEQTNRTCYMMELDPRYCDVIIQRWENLTGQQAVKVEEYAAAV